MNFDKQAELIEKKIYYTFKDKSLLKQAFTRTSYCNEHRTENGDILQSNEVLEFLGDSILSSAIITLLIKNHAERYSNGIKTKLTEGDFSNIKSKLSDKKNLSEAMKILDLQKYLLLGEGDQRLGIENEPSVMEDLFESIIGAIYLDANGDLSKLLKPISKMLDINKYIGEKDAPIQSFKNALQEWCADKKHRLPPPIYKTVGESGPDHKKVFERACCIGDKIYGTGTGKNQKIADASAAESALLALKKEFEFSKEDKQDPAEVMQKLKLIAKQNKKPSPEFKDLGESGDKIKEFTVECRFMGSSSTGTGLGKKEARERAAANMLKLLTPKKNTKEISNRINAKDKTKAKQFSKKVTRMPTKRKKLT